MYKEGICPVCGAEIEYTGDNNIDDNGGTFPWNCKNCGASGKEGYNRIFDKHYDVTDCYGNYIPEQEKSIPSKQQYAEELFKLISENPELPIVPMVDGEIPADDSGRWLGAWGHSRVDEYLLTQNHEWVVFKSDDDVFGVLEKHLSDEEYEKLPETETECRPYYDALPWIKAIIVNIDLPEVKSE